ncbi:MAG: hypothetical protein ACHQIK_08120 [Candidatus Acidiferrales bacterium]
MLKGYYFVIDNQSAGLTPWKRVIHEALSGYLGLRGLAREYLKPLPYATRSSLQYGPYQPMAR